MSAASLTRSDRAARARLRRAREARTSSARTPSAARSSPSRCWRRTSRSPAASRTTVEAFGPVNTVMPYGVGGRGAWSSRSSGRGASVGSLFTDDDERRARRGAGRRAVSRPHATCVDRTSAKESTGHGSPLPHLVHGGPGRAGGGEEMGGIRGVLHYMQRTAIQGSPTMLTQRHERVDAGRGAADGSHSSVPQAFRGAAHRRDARHASADGDGGRHRELRGHQRRLLLRAHGRHRGEGVDVRAARGARLLRAVGGGGSVRRSGARARCSRTTGSRSLRFTKPVYIGDTIQAKLTCKQKTAKETPPDGIPQGVVAWDVR